MKDRKNLEQQLAEKLGNRSIAPTVQAWDRIALSRQQNKEKVNKKRTFVYYAASVVLVLFSTGYFFMPRSNDAVTEPQVVTFDKTKEDVEALDPVIVPETVSVQTQTKTTVAYNKDSKQETNLVLKNEKIIVAPELYKKVLVNESLPQISVAVVQPVKVYSKDEMYEREVNDLLYNAIKEMAADKQLSAPTNDTALLKEVEAEMDDYYRDKAMKIFSLQNKTIRIAVKDKQ